MFDELLSGNARYAETFDLAGLGHIPAAQLAVVTCMDTRIDVPALLGLAVGDAHIIRNAGGRVTADVLRSLIVSIEVLGTRAVALIQHTDCGMAKATDDQLRALARVRGGAHADNVEFLTIRSHEEALRHDLGLLRTSPLLLPGLALAGFVYDVNTGLLAPLS